MPDPGVVNTKEDDAFERMRDWIKKWKKLNEEIASGGLTNPTIPLSELREKRHLIADKIRRVLNNYNNFIDNAESLGFTAFKDAKPEQGLNQDTTVEPKTADGGGGGGGTGSGGTSGGTGGSTSGGTSSGGGGGGGGGGSQGPAQPLPGIKGKDYVLRRGPNGKTYAIYKMKIAGNTIHVGVRLTSKTMNALGIDKNDAQRMTKAAFKNLEVLGASDEFNFRKGDRHPFKGVIRTIKRSYKGLDILDDDQVLGLLIGQAAGVYSSVEFEGMLKQTKWYRKTTAFQRHWSLDLSNKDRKVALQSMQERVRDGLEDLYGLEWSKHVKPSQIKKMAENIASGKFGDPSDGFQLWLSNQQDKAASLTDKDGNPVVTPAYMAAQEEQEALRAFGNRPEDMAEQLREQSLYWLGPTKNNGAMVDNDTLAKWANDLVTERKSEGDWQKFLRRQMKNLYPYFSENDPWQEQAAPYKAILEQLYGTGVGWDDPMLRSLAAFEVGADGTRTTIPDRAMSYQEYELALRNDPRFQGTNTWRQEYTNTIQQLMSSFGLR